MDWTEDLIERRVERMIDHADRLFMGRIIDQKTYDTVVRELNDWADRRYSEAEALNRAALRRQIG